MPTQVIAKYMYQIRCRNGAIVDNLQIHGQNEEEARRKLQQMYHHCEILDERLVPIERIGVTSYEDVLNLITNSQ